MHHAATPTDTTFSTRDGWRLALRRFQPAVLADDVPVLCVHGHATNGWSWYGGPGGGVVGALTAAGRDVWAIDLRGAASSSGPRRGASVRIADKASVDLPTAIEAVLARTGATGIDLVGHSLGGVMIYLLGLAGHPVAARVRRAVTVGSPLAVPSGVVPAPLRARAAARAVGLLGRLPVCGIAASFGRHAPMSALPTHFDPARMDAATYAGFMRHGVCDVFGAELSELSAWVRARDARVLWPGLSTGGAPGRLPFPTRFLVGADDGLTTAPSVAMTHRVIGGEASDLHVLPGYRHADILVGRDARADVGGLVGEWLAAPSSASVAAVAA